eukprot:jgi/Ulvmu1/5510/UM023_0046.1
MRSARLRVRSAGDDSSAGAEKLCATVGLCEVPADADTAQQNSHHRGCAAVVGISSGVLAASQPYGPGLDIGWPWDGAGQPRVGHLGLHSAGGCGVPCASL